MTPHTTFSRNGGVPLRGPLANCDINVRFYKDYCMANFVDPVSKRELSLGEATPRAMVRTLAYWIGGVGYSQRDTLLTPKDFPAPLSGEGPSSETVFPTDAPRIEIGNFGQLEHDREISGEGPSTCVMIDTYTVSGSPVGQRSIDVPKNASFEIRSSDCLVYRWNHIRQTGEWFGSELTRRSQEEKSSGLYDSGDDGPSAPNRRPPEGWGTRLANARYSAIDGRGPHWEVKPDNRNALSNAHRHRFTTKQREAGAGYDAELGRSVHLGLDPATGKWTEDGPAGKKWVTKRDDIDPNVIVDEKPTHVAHAAFREALKAIASGEEIKKIVRLGIIADEEVSRSADKKSPTATRATKVTCPRCNGVDVSTWANASRSACLSCHAVFATVAGLSYAKYHDPTARRIGTPVADVKLLKKYRKQREDAANVPKTGRTSEGTGGSGSGNITIGKAGHISKAGVDARRDEALDRDGALEAYEPGKGWSRF